MQLAMKSFLRCSAVYAAGFLAGKTQASYVSYNGLVSTPAMGWDNWNAFGCDVDQELLLGTAQKIVDFGLRDLGYEYVILDDCWSNGRYDNETIRVDATKFPNGMKYISDQLHSMGLKFGMYSSAGVHTCGGYAGSLGVEQLDADFFAANGVDYLKYDNCYNQGQAGTQKLSFDRYAAMSTALNATNSSIVYGLCNWGEDSPWNWAATISNSWRMSGDIYDSFSRPDPRCPCTDAYGCDLPGFHCSVLNILNKMSQITSKTTTGAYNDMDALEVGNGGMTDEQYKLHFSMWAMNASPLLMGTDIPSMSPESLSILSNPAVIALNQDPSASAATRVWRYPVQDVDEYRQGEISLWVRTLASGDTAVALINAGTMNRTMNATLKDIFTDAGTSPTLLAYDVYDLWANRMDNAMAQAILNGNATMVASNSTMRYNATATNYADGLAANSTALLGQKLSTSVAPMGTLQAQVPGNSIGLFRIRSQGTASMRRRKDEL